MCMFWMSFINLKNLKNLKKGPSIYDVDGGSIWVVVGCFEYNSWQIYVSVIRCFKFPFKFHPYSIHNGFAVKVSRTISHLMNFFFLAQRCASFDKLAISTCLCHLSMRAISFRFLFLFINVIKIQVCELVSRGYLCCVFFFHTK